MNIFFTSDLHLGHRNIIKHCNRPFDSVEEMDHAIITNLNSIVKGNDVLYILGDFTAYGVNTDDAIAYKNKIRCKKVHLIYGNHDKHYEGKYCFKSLQDYLELKENKQRYIMFHYPMVSWNHMRSGAIHLHGHQHNKMKYNNEQKDRGLYRYDVGVDANNFYPVALEDILNYYKDVIPWYERDEISYD